MPPIRRVLRAPLLAVLLALAPVAAGADGEALLTSHPSGAAAGTVRYAQDDAGTLWLAVSLRGAAPDAPLEICFVCGPTVGNACGYRTVGWVTTDARGEVVGAEFGIAEWARWGASAGAEADHVTVLDAATGDAYVSAPVTDGGP